MLRSIAALLLFVSIPSPALAEVTVSAAVSLREVLTDIADDYQRITGQRVEFNFGPSGRLAQQIEQGAPVDLFISAADSHVQRLIDSGRCEAKSRVVIAHNRLMVIVPADARFVPRDIDDIGDPRIRTLAIGQPATVPAGEYAAAALEAAGIAQALRPRIIHAANARQVLDYVVRNEVEAGIVYATDAVRAERQVRVAFEIDTSLHQPILYPAAVVVGSRNPVAASSFLEFLGSDPARERFRSHGFADRQPATQPAGR